MEKKDLINYNMSWGGKIPPQCVEIEVAILSDIMNNTIDPYYNIISQEMFYKEEHQLIYKAIEQLTKEDTEIELYILVDKLKKNGDLDVCGGAYGVTMIFNSFNSAHNINASKNALILIEHYVKRLIIKYSSEHMRDAYDDSTDVFELLNKIRTDIEHIEDNTAVGNTTTKNAISSALKYIEERYAGDKLPFIKTGKDKFDFTFALDEKTITVIAGQKGHLKSKFVMDIALGINDNNDNVAILWATMEEPALKLNRSMIARRIEISDRKLKGLSETKLTPEELEKARMASNEIGKYDIQYIEKSSSIAYIRASFKSFKKKRPNKICVLIIDNLGLVTTDKMKSIEADDHISTEIVKIRDESNGIILVVHHLNKSQLDKSNIDSGYRPREEDVRGSSRILDYANNVILVNFIAKYKDLGQSEKGKVSKIKIDLNNDNFPKNLVNIFMKINPEPDKNHADYPADNYYRALYNNINVHLSEQTLRRTNPTIAPETVLMNIINRYVNTVLIQKEIMQSRAVQYKTKIMDPVTYLEKEIYKRESVIDKESKYWYLYGDDPEKYRPILEHLFIIDGTKIREGGTDDSSVLIRLKADPSINKFTEI